jgi:hypothetical protein
MKLIEFLLHNWYILIVAFFLLSSLFKRSKGVSASSPPKQAMPPFGGGGGWGRGTTPTVTSTKQPDHGKERAKAAKSAEHRPDAYAEPVGVSLVSDKKKEPDFWEDTRITDAEDRAWTKHQPTFRPPASSSDQERLDAEKLAQGIMWAEILGPPRAKKPFRK